MTAGRGLVAAALAGAVFATGCGFGAGPSSKGTATLTVTRDYGTRQMIQTSESDPTASETVLRFLDRNASITTRYGGGFVQSIRGLAGANSGDRRFDWFFYVNGIESPIGSTQVRVHGGDRIWWDYRDWTSAMRVPAVVGSFPQPFAATAAAKGGPPIEVECRGTAAPCRRAAAGLRRADVAARVTTGRARGSLPRLLVGRWRAIRADPAAAQLAEGPATSGVFARFDGAGRIDALDVRGQTAERLGPDGGLIAAVRDGDEGPTWLVTGADEAGVRAAARLLDAGTLRDRYAVASDGHATIPLPLIARSRAKGAA